MRGSGKSPIQKSDVNTQVQPMKNVPTADIRPFAELDLEAFLRKPAPSV
jgi:hypothetical protein